MATKVTKKQPAPRRGPRGKAVPSTAKRTPKVKRAPKKRIRRTSATSKKRSWLRRLAIGTLRGTGRGLVKGVRKTPTVARGVAGWGKAQAARGKFAKGYDPEPGEIPGKARGRHKLFCQACADDEGKRGKRFADAHALTDHWDRVHAGEDPVERKRNPIGHTVTRGKTARDKDKVRVRPSPEVKSRSRHRPGGDRTPAAEFLARNKTRMAKIGAAVISDIDGAQHVRMGFQEIEKMPVGGVKHITAIATALEEAMTAGPEAMIAFKLKLLTKDFDSAVMVQLTKAEHLLQEVGQCFSAFIADMDEMYKKDIKIARERLGRPHNRPSDETLAS